MKRIALVLTCIIATLVILVVGFVIINLENKIGELEDQIGGLEEYIEGIEDLQSKIDFMLNPRIVTKLGASDVRTEPYRLYVDGFVCNCGFETVYNCGLRVVLFRNRQVVEEEVIYLGTLENGDFVNVSKDIHYDGNRLTDWSITPIFD